VTVSDKMGDTEYHIADTFSMDGIGASADGSALDSEGCLWVAFYRAGFVGRYSPAGEIVQRLEVPAWNVTSVCFVGPDSTQLIVVSQDNRENAVLGGCIFRTDVGVTGAPVGQATI
jgi:D-xylonolactonase